ncbi:hypothetical protein ACQPYK_38755 [Streptosporangium sp. CA-135522]|uniref:hypothetical protein n=1 Tax=Streptosporangium sp. CA-135522 TaxID=3240072 RepID=UPI003D8E653A
MRRILLILAILTPVLALAAPARAGGWAITSMDPVPAEVRPHTTYTLGFWLLQHGTHPYQGPDLGEVGLTFIDGTRSVHFTGVELREPAHYAAAVSLPAGTWKVKAVQGWFAPYSIGTLTVPGSLKVDPVPGDLRKAIGPRKDYWGEVHPPGFRAGRGADLPTVPSSPSASFSSPSPRAMGSLNDATTTAAVERDSWWRPPYAVAAVLVLAVAGALAYRLRRR